jgi:hypothetical protein
MRLVRKTRFAAALVALTTSLVLLSALPASATHVTVTDLTTPGFLIGKQVRKAVLGINMFNASGTATFDGLELVLTDAGGDGDFDLTLLSDLAGSPTGVAVYEDDGSVADQLDADDQLVSTFSHDGAGNVSLTVTSTQPTAAQGSYTYFVAVETSATIADGDDFTVGTASVLLGCAFDSTGSSVLDCPGLETTETITAETTAPTASLTAVPIDFDDNLVWTFSENVQGVTEDNVVLREDLSSTNLGATVTYNASAKTATINPDQNLEPDGVYDTLVNPNNADSFVTDVAGNPVELDTEASFQMADLGFTPGIIRGTKWFLNNQFDPFADVSFGYGSAGDKFIVGDWDGDGTFTPGIVRGNRWFLNNNTDANADIVFNYGSSTDLPVVGDWDGNGTWTPGVVRGNKWFLNNGFGPNADPDLVFNFGVSSDRPIVGDWDGDGTYTPGIVRGNVWYLNDEYDPFAEDVFAFGRSTDKPVIGDWDGDGASGPGVVRGNEWFLANDLVPTVVQHFLFGSASDIPVAGDWDMSIEAASAPPRVIPKILPGS